VTSDAVPRRRRLEPDERRRQILAAAIDLFGEKPYPMVSTTDLAERAGVARGLINHYFGNKRELYLEVVRAMMTIAPVPPDRVPTGSDAERAAGVVEYFLGVISRHDRAWLAAAGAEGFGWDPEVEQILAESDDRAAVWLIELMGRDPDDEVLRAKVRAYGGMVKAGGREWIQRESLDRDDLAKLLTDGLLALL